MVIEHKFSPYTNNQEQPPNSTRMAFVFPPVSSLQSRLLEQHPPVIIVRPVFRLLVCLLVIQKIICLSPTSSSPILNSPHLPEGLFLPPILLCIFMLVNVCLKALESLSSSSKKKKKKVGWGHEYQWGKTTVVHHKIRDNESGKEGTRPALETSAARTNLPSSLRVFL